MQTAINYMPKHGSLWDHWLYRAGNEYHMYYLYDERTGADHTKPLWLVGHAVSSDLVNWMEHPPVLRSNESRGVTSIATGSVIDFGGRYAMMITDHARGLCLAWSDNLYTWEWQDNNPVLPVVGEWYETREQMRTNPKECAAWCDPYLFRIDGQNDVYMLLNTRLREGDMFSRGCIALARSADMVNWTVLPPLLTPGIAARCETPQILCRGGKWYLIVSCHHRILADEFVASNDGERIHAAAFVFTSNRFDGEYRLCGDWHMFKDEGCYICKVETAPEGGDYVLTIKDDTVEYPPKYGETGITLPYRVAYSDGGGIRVVDLDA